MLERIHWLGHASFRINGPPHGDGMVIYLDPWRLPPDAPPADIILVSHDHHDHCSPGDIAQIRKPDTVILANSRAAALIGDNAQVLRPWQGAVNVGAVSIRGVPAYTVDQAFHAKSFEGLGFLISILRHDIYYAGDTDLIPEMTKIGCDIAILPVGGVFTMGFEQAAQAARIVRAGCAIPMHFGREASSSIEDGKRFCRLLENGIRAVELPVENSRLA